MEPNTNLLLPPDTFTNPWAYRIADFPRGYKLFFVERPAGENNTHRKDYYLYGMFFLFPSFF